MGHKIFSIVMLLLAVILAVLALSLPAEHLANIAVIIRFFQVMLPVLAVAALIKYLFKCNSHCHTENHQH